MNKMVLGILDCDQLSPELMTDYCCYATMFKALFAPLHPDISYRRYDVQAGTLPARPEECDAYLITGSKAGVYDDLAWLPPLRAFINQVYQRRIKLVGICFGHQLLADTLGGKAEKSEKGWGIGALHSRRVASASWMEPARDELCLLYSHQDQVSKLPEGAELLFSSDFCQCCIYQIPDRVLAFQGHPEFTKHYCARLMALRELRYAPGQYQQACRSLSQEIDEQVVAQWILNFLGAPTTLMTDSG